MDEKQTTEVKRINGYLREVTTFFDSSGKPISQVMNPLMVELKPRDILQIFVGAFLVAAPLSFTEEIWVLSETLRLQKVYSLLFVSMFVSALFIYLNFYRYKIKGNIIEFVKRVIATYSITAASVVLILFLIDKFPFATTPEVAMNRVIIISFPALFGAVITDYLK